MILLFRVRLATRSSISLGTWLMIALGCTCLFAQHDEIVHSAVTLSIPGVQVEPTKIALVQEALPLEQSAENSDAPTYGTWQIGRIAWHQSTLAHLMCREASALELMGHKAKPHSQELASRFLRKNSSRLAQISSEQAMILHSGLFAALQGRPLLLQSLSALDAAIEQQNVAIQNGIPIEDPTKLKGNASKLKIAMPATNSSSTSYVLSYCCSYHATLPALTFQRKTYKSFRFQKISAPKSPPLSLDAAISLHFENSAKTSHDKTSNSLAALWKGHWHNVSR